jgi:SanA protein
MAKSKRVFIILILVLVIPLFVTGILLYAFNRYATRVQPLEKLPHASVAIVFGAGYYKGGKPSQILQDRLTTAVQLYHNNLVDKILVSGDNSTESYNETQTMFDVIAKQGVPKEDIWRDFGGRDTYDTCYRAHVGWLVQHAILVSQAYHLPRALYCANALGIDAYGIPADGPYAYVYITKYRLRELPAMLLNWIEIHILKRDPEIPIQVQQEALEYFAPTIP